MKCKDALELLHAYFENGMDPANDKLLQKHLSSCTRCRAELEFLQKYRKNLSAIKPVKAPAGFMHRLKLKIQAENRGIFSKYYDAAMDFIRSIHVPAEAVALVLLVSIVFTLYRPDKLLTRWIDTPVTEYSENTGIHTEKIKNKSSVTDGPSSETYSSVRQKNDPARRIYPGIDD
ncbi:MAG TPA: zf-HC2 domain-containing protein, partial [Spirochaetota bacterium]|nr:zf-HC2 domain-containing protein [Spirochaetota bacterium]